MDALTECQKEIRRLRSIVRQASDLYTALKSLHQAAWDQGCSALLSDELIAAQKTLTDWDEF